MRIYRLTLRASRDIESIADYLAIQVGMDRSDQFLDGINLALQRIAQFPYIGRSRDELYPGIRNWHYKQYLIFYRLFNDEIEIFRVASAYQDLTALFEEDLDAEDE